MDSDNENQLPDTSADAQAHDDFDFTEIFAEFDKKAPRYEEILLAAKKFGTGHRYLINRLVSEPSMRTRELNLLFATHFCSGKLGKHPEAVMRVQMTSAEARTLAKTLVKVLNAENGKGGKNGFKPWRFVISTDEKSTTEYITMTGTLQNSTVMSETSELTKSERALLLAILEEMIRGDGSASIKFAHFQILKDPCKMSGVKCDEFLTKMARQKLLIVHDDSLEITPRVLIELEPWLRAKCHDELRICELCTKIIARPVFTAECQKCHGLSHFNCFKNATVISKKNDIECHKCKTMLSLDEVKQQIETKKKQKPKAVIRNDEEEEEEDENEEIDEEE